MSYGSGRTDYAAWSPAPRVEDGNSVVSRYGTVVRTLAEHAALAQVPRPRRVPPAPGDPDRIFGAARWFVVRAGLARLELDLTVGYAEQNASMIAATEELVEFGYVLGCEDDRPLFADEHREVYLYCTPERAHELHLVR